MAENAVKTVRISVRTTTETRSFIESFKENKEPFSLGFNRMVEYAMEKRKEETNATEPQ